MRAFWITVAVMLFVAGVLWFGHDYLQAKADMDNPDARVPKAIEDNTPLRYVREYEMAKQRIIKLEMVQIRNAIMLFQVRFGKNPESLEELVDAGCIGPGALQDTFRQDYRLREIEGRWFLLSSGKDQILNTDDDVVIALDGTMRSSPPPPEPTVQKPTGRTLDWYPDVPEKEAQNPLQAGP